MSGTIILKNAAQRQELQLKLSDSYPDMTETDLSSCEVVFEDGYYSASYSDSNHLSKDVASIIVNVNDECIGHVSFASDERYASGAVAFDIPTTQPFLLQYDLIKISVEITLKDGSVETQYADYLLCVSRNEEDTNNIQHMLLELASFDDAIVNEWLFSFNDRKGKNRPTSNWQDTSFKSVKEFVSLADTVYVTMRNNLPYFRTIAKHVLRKTTELMSYEKAKTITTNSFDWLMKNTDKLIETTAPSAIQFNKRHYLPTQIISETALKSFDIYENHVVVDFLCTVVTTIKRVLKELGEMLEEEAAAMQKIADEAPAGYTSPVLTIKAIELTQDRALEEKLAQLYDGLQKIYQEYINIFGFKGNPFSSVPKKAKIFQEIDVYNLVFRLIIKWIKFGDFSLSKERMMLKVKTLDGLFEYFALMNLLKMLSEAGYEKDQIYHFKYDIDKKFLADTGDSANTFILKKEDIKATLYYQPVISCFKLENKLTLFRTTLSRTGSAKAFYTPDFVLKIEKDKEEEYFVFDAKFARRGSITHTLLPDVIQKYSVEMSVAKKNTGPKMVWILQGRVEKDDKPVWKYQEAPLLNTYRPATSYGILSMNTVEDSRKRLWSEIKKNSDLI